MQQASTYIQMVERCEKLIQQIRNEVRAGQINSETVGEAMFMLEETIKGVWYRAAARLSFSQQAFDEAVELMRERLHTHILSLSFPSLETQFGAYLRTAPQRAVIDVSKKYKLLDSLEAPLNDTGETLAERLADSQATMDFDMLELNEDLQQAMSQLSPEERQVLQLRLDGFDNPAIAIRLGFTATTISKIYHRALKRIRTSLNYQQEQ